MELIFDFFEDHVKAAAVARSRRPLALGLLGFILGALSFFVAMAVSGRLSFLPFGWIALALFLLWEVGMSFVLVAVLHLIAELEGFQGSAAGLFVLFGMANLVWVLAVPVALILMAGLPKYPFCLSAAFLLVGFCNLSLKARSLQDAYQVSAGRAWMTLILPYLATLMISGLAFFLVLAGLLSQMLRAFD